LQKNPAKDVLFINKNNKNEDIEQINIFDMAGKTVASFSANESRKAYLDISTIENGYYTVEIQSNLNKYFSKIIISE